MMTFQLFAERNWFAVATSVFVALLNCDKSASFCASVNCVRSLGDNDGDEDADDDDDDDDGI